MFAGSMPSSKTDVQAHTDAVRGRSTFCFSDLKDFIVVSLTLGFTFLLAFGTAAPPCNGDVYGGEFRAWAQD